MTDTDVPSGPMPPVSGWQNELSQPLVDALVRASELGGDRKTCALACGVKPGALEFWLSEGMRPDAEPLVQQLSARFHGSSANVLLGHADVVRRSALWGEGDGGWKPAFATLKARSPEWGAPEPALEEPETSFAERKALFIGELRRAFETGVGELAAALREAGIPCRPAPATEESSELHALLERGRDESQSDG